MLKKIRAAATDPEGLEREPLSACVDCQGGGLTAHIEFRFTTPLHVASPSSGRIDGNLRSPEVTVRVENGSAISLGLLEPVLVVGVARGNQAHYLVVPIARAMARRELGIPPGR